MNGSPLRLDSGKLGNFLRNLSNIKGLTNEFRGSGSDEIINFLKTKVSKYSLPRKVHIIDTMPLTVIQKVDKKKLREMAIQSANS